MTERDERFSGQTQRQVRNKFISDLNKAVHANSRDNSDETSVNF